MVPVPAVVPHVGHHGRHPGKHWSTQATHIHGECFQLSVYDTQYGGNFISLVHNYTNPIPENVTAATPSTQVTGPRCRPAHARVTRHSA